MFDWFKKSSGDSERHRKPERAPEAKPAFRPAELPPLRPEQATLQEKFTHRAVAYLKAALPRHTVADVSISHTDKDAPIVRPLTDGLCVCYVVDKDNAYHYIQQRHLLQDGVSEDELHRIGLRNLTDLVSKRSLRVHPHPDHKIYPVLMGGDFEASLILLDQIWDRHFRQFVSGEYAVAIPNRDVLAFCDSSVPAGLDELRQLIGKVHKTGDHPISDKIYVRRDGNFIPRAA